MIWGKEGKGEFFSFSSRYEKDERMRTYNHYTNTELCSCEYKVDF